MHVKIETACVVEGKRKEAGSVIEVPAAIFELNQAWMKPTDEPERDGPAKSKDKEKDADK